MEKIVLRHLKGSKAGQMEEFPLDQARELVFGREATAGVRFDPDRDDVVGRVHARLTQDPSDKFRYDLVDMSSRNGTFLNRQRVNGSAAITPGDVIQLGAGGPEIQFDIEPRPADLVKSTRLAMSGAEMAGSAAATRVEGDPSMGTAAAPRSGVGKATVERMISGTRQEGRRNLVVFGGIAAALVGAIVLWQSNVIGGQLAGVGNRVDSTLTAINTQAQGSLDSARTVLAGRIDTLSGRVGMTEAEIAAEYARAVVMIQVGWHLSYTRTGEQVYHKRIVNSFRDAQGRDRPIMLDGRAVVAAYIQTGERKVEPVLTVDDRSGWPIGMEGSGSGFVVSSDGFILTNKHVGSGWRSSYDAWNAQQLVGVLTTADGRILLDAAGDPVLVPAPHDWVPSESDGQTLQGGFEGRLDYLRVYFKGNTTPFNTVDQPRVSDRHDVALIKISSAATLPKVALNDNFDTIVAGTRVTLLGYPGISDNVYTQIQSRESFKRAPELRVVPDPTLTSGIVSKIIRSRELTTDGRDPTFSLSGDRYQLDILATGQGASGGPLFDNEGRVVAIFFAAKIRPDAAERVTFAVPIRYAMELLGIGENAPLR